MKYTGIKATKAEIKRMKKQLIEARNTPVMAMSSADALNGRDFAIFAWDKLKKDCHELALKHGLPEIQGFYGLDLDKGEFVETA